MGDGEEEEDEEEVESTLIIMLQRVGWGGVAWSRLGRVGESAELFGGNLDPVVGAVADLTIERT